MQDPGVSSSQMLTDLSASEVAQATATGRLSAREIVEAHIERIGRIDRALNAIAIPMFERAREEAAERDDALRRGEPPGPLHGVPVTIKEQFLVEGTDTTVGLPHLVGHPRAEDGPVVARLRAAGAVILGKTNVVQLLAAYESDNPVYGTTNNPWDLSRTPGGSSGGESAIIAARGSTLGLGGDLGGSVRVPAHFCGIAGLKPTSWRLPLTDTPMDLFGTGQEAIVYQPGPMARSVADLELAMMVMVSSGHVKYGCPPVPWRDPSEVSVEQLRVGICPSDDFFPASPAIRRAIEQAGAALEQAGARVVPFTIPDLAEAMRIFTSVMTADGGAGFKALLQGARPHPLLKGLIQGATVPRALRPIVARVFEGMSQPRVARIMRTMGSCSARGFMQLVEERNNYQARWLAEMDAARIDMLLCPPYATPAPTHGATEPLLDAAAYAQVFNVTGMPAGVVPVTRVRADEESDRDLTGDIADRTAGEVERGSAGLPVGVQVVARHWREDLVLRAMGVIEGSSGFEGVPALGS